MSSDPKPSWELNESYHKRSNTVVLTWRKNARQSPKIRFLARAIVSSRHWLVPPSHVVGWSHPPTHPPHCVPADAPVQPIPTIGFDIPAKFYLSFTVDLGNHLIAKTLNPADSDSTKFKLILCNSPTPIHVLSPYGRKVVFFSPWHIT